MTKGQRAQALKRELRAEARRSQSAASRANSVAAGFASRSRSTRRKPVA